MLATSGSGCQVPAVRFRVPGSGFHVPGVMSRVSGSGCQVPDFVIRVSGPGFHFPGFMFRVRVSGFWFQVPGFRVHVPGFRFRVSGAGMGKWAAPKVGPFQERKARFSREAGAHRDVPDRALYIHMYVNLHMRFALGVGAV